MVESLELVVDIVLISHVALGTQLAVWALHALVPATSYISPLATVAFCVNVFDT